MRVLFLSFILLYGVNCQDIMCYKCLGILCEAEPKFLLPCLNDFEWSEPSCYFVAWNTSKLFGVYRGCYEPGDPYLDECNNNRLSNCMVCTGNGCNNWPIYQDTIISCKKCDFYDCPREDIGSTIQINQHTCPRFVTGTIPRCMTIYEIDSKMDKFLCANEMSEWDLELCQLDRFETICRYCEAPNCNFEHFRELYGQNDQPGFQLLCEFTHALSSFCDRRAFFYKPYAACVGNMASEDLNGTCLTAVKENEYEVLTRNENVIICNSKLCNTKEIGVATHAKCRLKYGIYEEGICGALWACCNRLHFYNEYRQFINWEVCETMAPCWQRDLCSRCCDFYLPGNNSGICHAEEDKLTEFCYQCASEAECAEVSQFSMNKTTQCRGSRTASCFIHLLNGEVHRGCVDLLPNYPFAEDCIKLNTKVCAMCNGKYCNYKSLKTFCYHCGLKNNRCAYDQELNLIKDCGLAEDLTSEFGCVTKVRYDGLTFRSCYRATDPPCPKGYKCDVCYGHLCNSASYQFRECISCRDTAYSDCAQNTTWMFNVPIKCPILYDQPLCYILIMNNGTIERGCTANVLYKEKLVKYTKTDPIQSYFCDANLCNYFSIDRISRCAKMRPRLTLVFILALFWI